MRPGQDTCERGEEIVECPGEDHVVVDIQQEDNDRGGQADTCNRCRD